MRWRNKEALLNRGQILRSQPSSLALMAADPLTSTNQQPGLHTRVPTKTMISTAVLAEVRLGPQCHTDLLQNIECATYCPKAQEHGVGTTEL